MLTGGLPAARAGDLQPTPEGPGTVAEPEPAQPLPELTPAKQLRRVSLTLPVGEAVRVPAPLPATLPPELQHEALRWERRKDGWYVTALAPGDLLLVAVNTELRFSARERAARWPAAARVGTYGGYPASQALLHWGRDFLHPQAMLSLQGGLLIANGPNLLPAELQPKAAPANNTLAWEPAEKLLISNWPERILGDGVVFDERLPAGPARVMLHHRNMPDQPQRWLEVELLQPAGSSRTYAVTSQLVGPSNDEIFAGHQAASRYVDALAGSAGPQGYLLEVRAGGRHLVERWPLKPSQTVSGMLWIRPLGEGALGRLRISVREPLAAAPTALLIPAPPIRTARGVFPAFIERTLTYAAGKTFLYEDVGAAPYLNSEPESPSAAPMPNPGNFGTVYRYTAELSNPEAEDREVRLEASARGGPARATMFLEGERVDPGLLNAQARMLKRWTLPAGSTRKVKLELFPQAGSNFPLALVFSSGPVPGNAGVTSPPVDAAWRIP